MRPIYLDYNASTPVDPVVAAAMRPFLDEAFGNPSSGHWASAPAKAALDRAREQVAALLGAAPDEIVFTSGGSEANNLAIKGTYFAAKRGRAHIITSTIEHPAVLAPCRFIERLGGSVTYLPVDRAGLIGPEDVRRAITPQTLLTASCTPTTKSAPSSLSQKSARSRGSMESAFTLMQRNRSEKSRPGWTSLASIC